MATVVDTKEPTAPANNGITEITQSSARINWIPSTDSVAVDHYQLWYFFKPNRFPGH